jgi:hypothetical protein
MINDLINKKKKPENMIGTGFRLDFLHHLKSPNQKLNLKFNYNYKNINVNINLFKKMLQQIDINENTFTEWLNEYIN